MDRALAPEGTFSPSARDFNPWLTRHHNPLTRLTNLPSRAKLAPMLTQLTCAICIIDDLQRALETTVPDEAARLDILREAMAWLGETFHTRRIPSYYITRVHRLLKQRAGLQMPFRQLREQCNKAGLAVRTRGGASPRGERPACAGGLAQPVDPLGGGRDSQALLSGIRLEL